MNLNVRISGALREFVEHTTSEGDFENVSEYVRDLIRKDKAASEEVKFQILKAHLQAAFSAPRDEYIPTTADDIRAMAADRLNK